MNPTVHDLEVAAAELDLAVVDVAIVRVAISEVVQFGMAVAELDQGAWFSWALSSWA